MASWSRSRPVAPPCRHRPRRGRRSTAVASFAQARPTPYRSRLARCPGHSGTAGRRSGIAGPKAEPGVRQGNARPSGGRTVGRYVGKVARHSLLGTGPNGSFSPKSTGPDRAVGVGGYCKGPVASRRTVVKLWSTPGGSGSAGRLDGIALWTLRGGGRPPSGGSPSRQLRTRRLVAATCHGRRPGPVPSGT
jgi:hypothetical protein